MSGSAKQQTSGLGVSIGQTNTGPLARGPQSVSTESCSNLSLQYFVIFYFKKEKKTCDVADSSHTFLYVPIRMQDGHRADIKKSMLNAHGQVMQGGGNLFLKTFLRGFCVVKKCTTRHDICCCGGDLQRAAC